MHKSRLQEMCNHRQWPLPQYTITRCGPDHNPRFRAYVLVNGNTFDAPGASRSSKEAQNKAAQAAVYRLATVAATPPPTATPPPRSPAGLKRRSCDDGEQHRSSEGQTSYKLQLQSVLLRRKVVPIYECVRECPPHVPRFKATVEVDGRTFESPQFYNTKREAEHAAAKVAFMALPPELKHQDETGFYKSLLQELVQKEGISLPVYTTVGDGVSHMPNFSSTVQLGDEIFHGDVAKTKKQAEINAAKVAWCEFKERRARRVASGLSFSGCVQNDSECVSASSQSAVMDSKWPKTPSIQLSDKGQKEVLHADIEDKNCSRTIAAKNAAAQTNHLAAL